MSKKHIFLRVFSKITIFACVFCAFFASPVFATLPAGFTELEYIEGTGTQWIDTGYVVNTKTKAQIGINMTMVTGDVILGYCVNDTGGDCWRLFNYSSTLYFDMGGQSTRIIGPANSFPAGSYQEIMVGNFYVQNLTKNAGVSGATQSSIYTPAHSMTLFHDVDHASNSTGKIYYLKIFDNESLVRNFIPAKRNSDGVIGMYDTVTNTFFTNQGTDEFIAGPIAHCKTFGTDGVTCTECEADYILNNDGGCSEKIKIATTKYVDEEFAAAEAKLATTVQTIESVVSRTIAQTEQIATLHETKQTRPDESCPANMKCLLVQDEDGTPHWYPIIEP